LRFDLLLVWHKLVIPIGMARPTPAGKAFGVLPVLAASRADTTGVERIPDATAGRLANPTIECSGLPFALRTKYLHFSHVAPRRFRFVMVSVRGAQTILKDDSKGEKVSKGM